jgi:hypothetical protein
MFLSSLSPEISQGDVFEDVEVLEVLGGREESYKGAVVLLSHDCEFDKPNQAYVLVARVLPLAEVHRSQWDQIRRGSALNAVYLPGVGERPESFINLRFIHRLPKDCLREAALLGRRVASMTPDGRAALVAYLYRFFARKLPA